MALIIDAFKNRASLEGSVESTSIKKKTVVGFGFDIGINDF